MAGHRAREIQVDSSSSSQVAAASISREAEGRHHNRAGVSQSSSVRVAADEIAKTGHQTSVPRVGSFADVVDDSCTNVRGSSSHSSSSRTHVTSPLNMSGNDETAASVPVSAEDCIAGQRAREIQVDSSSSSRSSRVHATPTPPEAQRKPQRRNGRRRRGAEEVRGIALQGPRPPGASKADRERIIHEVIDRNPGLSPLEVLDKSFAEMRKFEEELRKQR